MLAGNRPQPRWYRSLALSLFVLVGGIAGAGLAQQPEQVPFQQPDPTAQPQSTKQGLRQLFAGTLATVLQGVGAVVTSGLTQSVNGAILGWFNRPGRNNQQIAQSIAAAPVADAASAIPQQPEQQPQFVDQQAQTAVDPATSQAEAPMIVGDAALTPYAPSGVTETLHAGLAFEVHLLGVAGSTPVDPRGHTFMTGDRFVVHYRPTLPGQVAVFNVNPLGEERQIDQVDVAAGQLAMLGPYEFRDNKGSETLRLLLMPCTTDAMTAATRDIVKVEDIPATAGLNLTNCNSPAPRSLRTMTRDIAKVEVEGQTAFALDPVSPQEVASGEFAPREVTLVFLHQ